MEARSPQSNKLWWVLFGIAVGVGLGLAVLLGGNWIVNRFENLRSGSQPASGLAQIDQAAPDFELISMDGTPVRLSDLRGRVVLINFWATWCGPCVREMPLFQHYSETYAGDLVILGIDMQGSQTLVQPFIEKMGISYPVLLDPSGDVTRQYQVIALPNTFLIDRQGIVRQRHIGVMTEDQLLGYLDQLEVGK